MGCGYSLKSRKMEKRQKDSSTNDAVILTDREILLIQETWSIIQDEILAIGVYIYYSFFQSELDLRNLFSSILHTNEAGTKMVMHQDKLERHAILLMETLGFAVTSLDNIDKLQDFLHDLGGKHFWMKVQPIMLQRLWPVIDDSFRQVLCDVYTTEVRDTWNHFMQFIFDNMKVGIDAMALAQKIKLDPSVGFKLDNLSVIEIDPNKDREDANFVEGEDGNKSILAAKPAA